MRALLLVVANRWKGNSNRKGIIAVMRCGSEERIYNADEGDGLGNEKYERKESTLEHDLCGR